MSVTIKGLPEIVENPGEWVRDWKKRTGKKAIGCFPMYVPEEVIHAAGMLPLSLLGDDRPISLAQQYIPTYLCHPVQSNFDLALRGGLDYLDGLVFPDLCDQVKKVSSLWKFYHTLPFHYHLMVPKRQDSPASLDFTLAELGRFKRAVEGFAGKEISQGDLKRSIALYNETRRLLNRLYQMRRQKPALFGNTEVENLVKAAMLLPKEEYNQLLTSYLETKEKQSPVSDSLVRLVLWGNQCEDVEPGFMDILQQVGGVVVADDLYTGFRYFASPVAETGDPWRSLAQAYLNTPPCPSRHHQGKDWASYLIQAVRDSQAKGTVIVLQKFCEIHTFDYPYIKKRLAEQNIPHLAIETDHSGATARVRTRLEAFIETLREG